MHSFDKLIIEDTSFSHAPSASWSNHPEKFVWDRNTNQSFEEIVLTNLRNVDFYSNKKVYGWIIEPPDISKEPYDFAINNFSKFEKIFTYDSSLLKVSEKFEFLPIGGCWIEEKDRVIHKKNKLICTINSTKRLTKGHNFRHEIISKIKNVDLFGTGYNKITNKIDVLKDYMFCIVVENQKMDFLFTEKIIDCFITGTIPIYWGCPSIYEFFEEKGFFTFETIEELNEILNSLNEDVYYEKINYVEKNYNLSKKYTVADNLVYEKIRNEK